MTVYEVIRRLAANQISTRNAGMILTALDNITRNSPQITNSFTARTRTTKQ